MRALALLAALGLVTVARADPAPQATFALIVGVNRSVDRDQPALQYADDDAVLYWELFRATGAKTYLLTRVDEETRHLHPQATAEAAPPTDAALQAALASLTSDLQQARAAGLTSVLYVVYAGHGNLQGGQGYVALEDQRLFGRDLDRLFKLTGATHKHLIVDACYSFFLAFDRGPGGKRRPLPQLAFRTLALSEDIGLLLSTASARESHEWQGFQSGIFSYEVRSGLYGAADLDGDGLVSYREIAAFVESANAPVPNSRFRPEVYARPPRDATALLDLRLALSRHVELPRSGHYLIENSDGVRQVELHRNDDGPIRLVRPATTDTLYVLRVDDQTEYRLASSSDRLVLASADAAAPRVRARGAAHEAFSRIFSRPLEPRQVAAYQFAPLPDFAAYDERVLRRRRVQLAGIAGFALSAVSFVSGIGLSASAQATRSSTPSTASQLDVARRNQLIGERNLQAGILYGISGALALGGTLLYLLPRAPRLDLALGANSVLLGWRGEF